MALYEMCRRVWETLSDNVIDHAGITARATKNASIVLSRQWWRTPCRRSEPARRSLSWTNARVILVAVDRDGVLWIVDALLYLGEGGHGDDIEEWRRESSLS